MQDTLFDLGGQDEQPPRSNETTSREAAASMRESATVLRERVYQAILRSGTTGRTDEELQDALCLSGNTERPRRWELAKAGRIVECGETRVTRSGRRAAVWVVTW